MAFRALRHRDFALYFSGQLVSWVGTWMQTVALGWWVHRLTGQAAWLGVIAFTTQAPAFLLGPLGGVWADRSASRKLVLLTQSLLLLQALTLAWLAHRGPTPVAAILALSLVLGIVNAFDLPARQVLLAHAVPREDLPNAIGLNSALFHGSRIVGPALAGWALAVAGEAGCFAANALSYLASLITVALLRAGVQAPPDSGRSVLQNLRQGVDCVRHDARLKRVFLFTGAVVLLGMPYTALLPMVVSQSLGAGPKALGWLMGAGGLGATAAALVLASLRHPDRLPRLLPFTGLGLALFLAGFAFARHLPLAMLLLAGTSFCLVASNTGTTTWVNHRIPPALRGRVVSLHTMVFMGAMPLGALIGGLVAQRLGVAWTLAGGALGCALAALLYRQADAGTEA